MSIGAAREQHRVIVTGAVDGVGFRLWVQNVANSLKLGGSVRMRSAGVCEVIVQGERFCIRQLVSTCRRGPPGVVIASVEDELLPWDGTVFEFTVEH